MYILAFLGKLLRLIRRRESRGKELFIANLTHLTTMALHMIMIGAFSLKTGTPMNEILQLPLVRIVTIGIILAVNNLIAYVIPRWETIVAVLRTQSESEEARPFMMFLWFCNIFLLIDSVLCIADIRWSLLPLFLIGSTVLLEFFLIWFIRHIYFILKVHYLEEEHRYLSEKLETQNRNAAELRSKTVLDPMTGIFTRRYLQEQMESLLKAGVPFSFVFIDLDHLKQVNDREGHHAGDQYLVRFAKRFGAFLRKSDIFARIGGDEFAVLLPKCPQETAASDLGNIRFSMLKENSPPISFSYGIAYVAENSVENVEEIFGRADQAMYEDKQVRTK